MSFLANTETGSLVNRYVCHTQLCIPEHPTHTFCHRFSQDLRLVDIVLPRSLAVFLFGNNSYWYV
jgi:hypothetical protein